MNEKPGIKVTVWFNERWPFYNHGKSPARNFVVYRNVSEIHYRYGAVTGKIVGDGNRLAIESNVHKTGLTLDLEDVAEFETEDEAEIADHF